MLLSQNMGQNMDHRLERGMSDNAPFHKRPCRNTMSLPPLEPALLQRDIRGIPLSTRYDDVYHSADGGLAQARHVFLAGNALPERFREQRNFTLIETGFGTGLNFLATWQAWREHAPADARLYYCAVEKHPFTAADLHRLHVGGPLSTLADALCAQWPDLLPGTHRLHLENGRISLTLMFGEAADQLAQLDAQADAFYLDGFAPAKNPDMWNPAVYAQLARRARPDATLASYTAASAVRRGLNEAGFTIDTRPGFARKREMIVGRYSAAPIPDDTPAWFARAPRVASGRAIVLGAGMAGAAVTHRLAERGWHIDLIDRHPAPGGEASGNPAGILLPVLSADWNPLSQLACAGYGYMRRLLAQLPPLDTEWSPVGVLRLARNPRHRARQQAMLERLRLPEDFVRWVETDEAGRLCGAPVAEAGWWFPEGGYLHPPGLCRSLLQAHADHIHTHFGREVAHIEYTDDHWHARDANGQCIAQAPVLILANAADATRLLPAHGLPLRSIRGQISLLPGRPLSSVVCREGYIIPPRENLHCAGASFDLHDDTPTPTASGHQENLARVERLLPGFCTSIVPEALSGRVSFRCATPDRLPLIGALVKEDAFRHDFAELYHGRPWQPYKSAQYWPGLYLSLGHGARGLAWSALCAETLASAVNDEPSPLPRPLAQALHPARFLLREMRLKPEHRVAPRFEASEGE